MPPELCPNCGAEVPPKALACPECGADEESGWSERAQAQRLGLPDDEFDYGQFVKEEFGPPEQSPLRPRGIRRVWWVVAVILVLALLCWFLKW